MVFKSCSISVVEDFITQYIFVASGLQLTLEVTVAAILISVVFGTVLAILKHTHILEFFVDSFISVVRGTPLIVQLSLIYFSVPQLIGIKLSVFSASIIAFGMNSSAYTAEILRGGIKSIPKAQFEAALSLHIPKFYIWKDIILPQVIINVFPTIIHEIIALIKETAIISMIGGLEVTRRAQVLAAEQFTYFAPLCMAAITYYIIILMLEHFSKRVERHFRYAQNS